MKLQQHVLPTDVPGRSGMEHKVNNAVMLTSHVLAFDEQQTRSSPLSRRPNAACRGLLPIPAAGRLQRGEQLCAKTLISGVLIVQHACFQC